MREMLKAGESNERIQELKKKLLELGDVLIKQQTPPHKSTDQKASSSSF